MPAFLEKKLKKEYGDNPHAIYGTMNKIGAMHGNKETAKGKSMEKKHAMAEKMGHEPHHGSRHRKSQMKYFSGDKFKKRAEHETEENSWRYARENRMSDKRIF